MSKKTVKASMELPELPEGFEYTGEYRKARSGEYTYDSSMSLQCWNNTSVFEYPIIRKCEVWRDATAQDIYSALYGVEVFVRYGGKLHRLVGGQYTSRNPINGVCSLCFLLKQENGATFWAGACEVRVS